MKQTVILLGASGLTGSILLERLIADNNIKVIILFSRKETLIKSDKIREHIIDFKDFHKYEDKFKADIVFSCIGTTAKKTKNKVEYRDIDCGIPTTASKMAKKNGIKTFLCISALGANKNSSILYNNIKGEMEHNILSSKIENTYIFRPSLIIGTRKEQRLIESIGINIFKLINPLLLGSLKKYRSIKSESIAKAMHIVANNIPLKKIFSSDDIQEIADNE